MSIQRVIATILLVGLAVQAADEPPELIAMRKRYETERTRINEARDKAVGKSVAAYEAELKLLLANIRQQGDLDYVVAIQGELKRLETDRSAPTKPAPEPMKQLRAAQWGTRKAQDKADKQRDAQLAKLRKQYLDALTKLEKTLVADNRIEDAKAVRGETEAVEAREAMCACWMWVGQLNRIHRPDGTIWSATAGRRIGTWEYLATDGEGRKYRVETHGKYIETVTMSADGKSFWWTSDGKQKLCERTGQ